jgi:hypothetical protein
MCIRRDDRDEKRARPDLFTDGRVPDIAAAKLALIEPHFDPGGAQGGADSLGGLGVFGRVTKKDGSLAASG